MSEKVSMDEFVKRVSALAQSNGQEGRFRLKDETSS